MFSFSGYHLNEKQFSSTLQITSPDKQLRFGLIVSKAKVVRKVY